MDTKTYQVPQKMHLLFPFTSESPSPPAICFWISLADGRGFRSCQLSWMSPDSISRNKSVPTSKQETFLRISPLFRPWKCSPLFWDHLVSHFFHFCQIQKICAWFVEVFCWISNISNTSSIKFSTTSYSFFIAQIRGFLPNKSYKVVPHSFNLV